MDDRLANILISLNIKSKIIVSNNNRSGFLESILKSGKVIYKA